MSCFHTWSLMRHWDSWPNNQSWNNQIQIHVSFCLYTLTAVVTSLSVGKKDTTQVWESSVEGSSQTGERLFAIHQSRIPCIYSFLFVCITRAVLQTRGLLLSVTQLTLAETYQYAHVFPLWRQMWSQYSYIQVTLKTDKSDLSKKS